MVLQSILSTVAIDLKPGPREPDAGTVGLRWEPWRKDKAEGYRKRLSPRTPGSRRFFLGRLYLLYYSEGPGTFLVRN